ncbi:hypothetical protein KUF71_008658 [Frankliniella fusca]|uniref:Uncharacterized protein n=1 Tax=Frankliniella fusca TaxID=407009 RepID=A0AAE1HF81_9NEOP|nr:hypothetical protein KUF71_008658 [Frankliniella fusca]
MQVSYFTPCFTDDGLVVRQPRCCMRDPNRHRHLSCLVVIIILTLSISIAIIILIVIRNTSDRLSDRSLQAV